MSLFLCSGRHISSVFVVVVVVAIICSSCCFCLYISIIVCILCPRLFTSIFYYLLFINTSILSVYFPS